MRGKPERKKVKPKLKSYFKSRGKIAVALSGGMDSATLVACAEKVLGNKNCLALTANSPYMMSEEISDARRLCKMLGVEMREIKMDIPSTVKNNPPLRCFFCKMEIFSRLKYEAAESGFETLCDGTNADDVNDHRPGMRALKELGIESPFMRFGIGKKEIQKLALECEIDDDMANKAPYSCLLTRFENFTEINENKLKLVDDAENFIRNLGFPQVRVRVHSGNMARIEIPSDMIASFSLEKMKDADEFLREIGFNFVSLDMRGYVRGNMDGLNDKKTSARK